MGRLRKEKQKIQSRLVAKGKNEEHPTELIATMSEQTREMKQGSTRSKRRVKKKEICNGSPHLNQAVSHRKTLPKVFRHMSI